MTVYELLAAAAAAGAAGAVNALAGGGTLISFPALLALGVPPLAANVTNAIALCPGYFGATLAQRSNLQGQSAVLRWVLPAAIVGGLLGALVLLRTGERVFTALVPWMILFACALLAVQERVRAVVVRRLARPGHAVLSPAWTAVPVLLAAVYGGFFSAGMSVIVLAALGLTLDDTLTRLNAVKQIAAFSINVTAAVFFLASDHVIWPLVPVMALGALIGGTLGGRLAAQVNPTTLRWTVVVIGTAVAIVYFLKK
jgi:uncharacterized membrane protein YfcA